MLITTPGATDSNSYCSLEFAKEYFKTRLHSELWLPFPQKEAALQTATRLLDRYCEWEGMKVSQFQALDWPRTGVVDKDGYLVPDNIIPLEIKQATCEMAYSMLEEDRTADSDLKGFKSLKVGPLALEIDRRDFPEPVPDNVWALLAVYAKKPLSLSSAQVPVIRC